MADRKITDLPALTTPDPSDYFVTVDVSDTTDSSAGSTRKITGANLRQAMGPSGSAGYLPVTDGNGAAHASGIAVDANNSMSGHGAQISAQTGTSYTATGADRGKIITLSNASPITLTLPQTSTEAIPAGWQCAVIQRGVGTVTMVAQGADVIESKQGRTSLAGQHSPVTIIKLVAGTPNTWGAYGDLA
ncbi:MAG: hypothetical protein HQL66_00750 [Magnetococcales bacterium]|nr:hypothetical protein [Magnetococcales bacterium]